MNEIESIHDHSIKIELKSKITQHFITDIRTWNHTDFDDEYIVSGAFALRTDELKDLLNHKYLNLIEFDENDSVIFRYLATIQFNESAEDYLDLKLNLIDYYDSDLQKKSLIINSLINQFMKDDNCYDLVKTQFYNQFRKEKPLQIFVDHAFESDKDKDLRRSITRYNS